MKNLKQLTAIAMCSVFAAMQVSFAAMDTGLGVGNGGAVINSTDSNFAGLTTGTNSATLEFKGNSHVNWNTLNVNGNETLNFNAQDGVNGISVLNTVNNNMSKIYGQINANSGIKQLIISNPNGVLFDGATFSTAGDTMITTKNLTGADVNNINVNDGSWGTLVTPDNNLVSVQVLNDSDFSVGGKFTIVAPQIVGQNSRITAGEGLKLITANGADFIAQNKSILPNKAVTRLKAMDINGNIEIVNDIGALSITGTDIKGDLTAETGGIVCVDGIHDDTGALQKMTTITGNADLTAHNQQLIMRDTKVDGNLIMENDGGAVELRNAKIGGNADLTTTGWQPINHQKYNHYVHVSGNTDIGGDLNISSSQNIHIGNYQVTNNPYSTASTANQWKGDLLPGELNVGGDIKAEVTQGGHIMTTINTTADNIDYTAKSYNDGTKIYGGNILSDDKATITANTYKFKSDGYIGGLKSNDLSKVDDKIIHVMEEYQFIPDDTTSHEYMNIDGGVISKIETPKQSTAGKDVQVYIRSNNNLIVNGANAGVINLVAPDKKITVTGPDVHAKEINVGGRTGTLQIDFPGRDFTTNYTNIKDGVVKTIKPTDEITYDLTNKPNTGYNSPDFKQTDGTNTTYLVGPEGPVPPPPPQQQPTPPNDDNVRVINPIPEDPVKPMANTPIAYAADLDDDEDVPCRKNVDGSVTVVRAYPVMD